MQVFNEEFGSKGNPIFQSLKLLGSNVPFPLAGIQACTQLECVCSFVMIYSDRHIIQVLPKSGKSRKVAKTDVFGMFMKMFVCF